MARPRDPLTSRVLELAADGRALDLDAATVAIFGARYGRKDRYRVKVAVDRNVEAGRLVRARRAAFRLVTSAVDAADDDRPELPPATSAVEVRLNRLAMIVNAAHEELAELRHDLRVAETIEDSRPSFPMRCAEPWERET